MNAITYIQSRNIIKKAFKDVIGSIDMLLGYSAVVMWPGLTLPKVDSDLFWFDVHISDLRAVQQTLSTPKRLYNKYGAITIGIHCPKVVADSFNTGEAIASIINSQYSDYPDNDVDFSNCRITVENEDEIFYNLQVACNYTYCELH